MRGLRCYNCIITWGWRDGGDRAKPPDADARVLFCPLPFACSCVRLDVGTAKMSFSLPDFNNCPTRSTAKYAWLLVS